MSLRRYPTSEASDICFAESLIKTYVHILTCTAHNCTSFSTSSLVLHILACDLGEGLQHPHAPADKKNDLRPMLFVPSA